MAELGAERKAQAAPVARAPRLNWELEPWRASFLRNLRDLFRRPTTYATTSRPGTFWPDVFVPMHIPWRTITLSGTYHAMALAIVLVFLPWLWSIWPRVETVRPTDRHTITYYDVSEYLPAVNTGSAPAKVARKADPVYAKQPIVSLPPTPDNFKQTIINPQAPNIIQRDVPLPNIVVWTTPAPVPVAATERKISSLALSTPLDVIRPTVAVVNRGAGDLKSTALPAPAVIEPTVSVEAAKRPIGELNIADLENIEVPVLAVPAQRAALGGESDVGVVPPPPSTEGLGGATGSGTRALGQLIALSTTPVAPSGPIRVPEGSRHGQFAAGPEGRPGATGAPAMAGGGDGAGGTGSGPGGPGSGGNGPAGIYVGGPNTGGGAVAGATAAALPPTAAGPPRTGPSREQFLAAARPKTGDIFRDTPSGTTPTAGGGPSADNSAPSSEREIENAVFKEKRFYQMTLNMPNLTSSGGSWIVRFAELNETREGGEVSAPVALNKVDPAYPAAMRRAHIEGVVMLYAIIRADGSVAEVRVLRGIEGVIDESARKALARWRFRPGKKNGAAVDLEAVVSIPFKLGRAF